MNGKIDEKNIVSVNQQDIEVLGQTLKLLKESETNPSLKMYVKGYKKTIKQIIKSIEKELEKWK